MYRRATPYKKRTITSPNGTKKALFFDRTYEKIISGSLVKDQVFSSSNNLLRETNYNYIVGNSPTTGLWWFNTGAKLIPSKTVVSQDGDTYTTDYQYNLNKASSSYSYDNPIQVKRYSSVSGSTAPKITNYTYEHNVSKWILGLAKTVITNGRNEASYTYDNKGQLTSQNRYGYPHATIGYNSEGTMAWFKVSDVSTYGTDLSLG